MAESIGEGETLAADAARKTLRLDDLVAGVFVRSKLKAIPSSQLVLQQLFFRAQQRTDLPDDVTAVLSRLHFGAGDIFPFSRELEASIMRLQIGGILTAPNPDYSRFEMNAGQKRIVRSRVNRLPKEDQDALTDIGAHLAKVAK